MKLTNKIRILLFSFFSIYITFRVNSQTNGQNWEITSSNAQGFSETDYGVYFNAANDKFPDGAIPFDVSFAIINYQGANYVAFKSAKVSKRQPITAPFNVGGLVYYRGQRFSPSKPIESYLNVFAKDLVFQVKRKCVDCPLIDVTFHNIQITNNDGGGLVYNTEMQQINEDPSFDPNSYECKYIKAYNISLTTTELEIELDAAYAKYFPAEKTTTTASNNSSSGSNSNSNNSNNSTKGNSSTTNTSNSNNSLGNSSANTSNGNTATSNSSTNSTSSNNSSGTNLGSSNSSTNNSVSTGNSNSGGSANNNANSGSHNVYSSSSSSGYDTKAPPPNQVFAYNNNDGSYHVTDDMKNKPYKYEYNSSLGRSVLKNQYIKTNPNYRGEEPPEYYQKLDNDKLALEKQRTEEKRVNEQRKKEEADRIRKQKEEEERQKRIQYFNNTFNNFLKAAETANNFFYPIRIEQYFQTY
jgi:hypothetical protein